MAGDDDTMATDDTGVVAQAPPHDADANAIPLVLVLGGGNPDPLHNLNNIRAAVADLSETNPDPAPICRYLGGVCSRSC